MSNGSDSDTLKTSDDQVERAMSDDMFQKPIPMTFKRIQTLAALLGLSAVAILPLFLISGGLSISPLQKLFDGSVYSGGYWRQ